MIVSARSPTILLVHVLLFGCFAHGFAPSHFGAETTRKLPTFELKLVDGSTIQSKDLERSVIVIDFWATWCKPCIDEVGDYNTFYNDYKAKGVRLLAVAVDSGTADEVRKAVQDLKILYPVAAPTLKELDIFGDILVFPTTWVIDSQGLLVKEILGVPRNKHQTIRTVVDRLVADASK